jgi:hypothetical protein
MPKIITIRTPPTQAAWTDEQARQEYLRDPAAPLAALARRVGWPRSKLRRAVARWQRDAQAPSRPAPAGQPRPGRGRILAGLPLIVAGLAAAVVGAAETSRFAASWSAGPDAALLAALALVADGAALFLPAAAGMLWSRRRRGLAAMAVALWALTATTTFANLLGFAATATETRSAGRGNSVLEHQLAVERIGRLRTERQAITGQTRPSVATRRHAAELDRALVAAERELRAVPAIEQRDPQAAAVAALLAGLSQGFIAPTADTVAVARLLLLAALPLAGGLLLAVGLALSRSEST